ncbi:MAG: hypothetical protein HQL97_05085 [Magnetococcales bacterium]|nr:hypothetical protein [Magnetococcales bacterium]MBF0261202.1 hypothetical protein [Magnetococcales bacterium]
MELPSLEQILEKRGFVKSAEFNDYQDHIEANEQKFRPARLNLPGIHVEGSMHLALGRIIPSRKLTLKP